MMRLEIPNFATLRETRKDISMAVSPSRAIAQAGYRLTRVLQSHGPHAIGLCLSQSISAETRYVATKFAHGTLRTARLFDDLTDAVAALQRGDIHALWLFSGESPGDALLLGRSLLSADLVILQDDTAPSLPVDIFFPSQRGESSAAQEVKADWWWVQQVAWAMGFRAGLQFATAAQIREELSHPLF
jgi:hypothetical protein